MRTILLAVCLAMLTVQAQAISRYNSTSMRCAEVQSAVADEGAVILRWKSPTSGVQRYDRFVTNDGFCASGEEASITTVPTADARSCPAYNCKRIERDWFHFKRRWLLPD